MLFGNVCLLLSQLHIFMIKLFTFVTFKLLIYDLGTAESSRGFIVTGFTDSMQSSAIQASFCSSAQEILTRGCQYGMGQANLGAGARRTGC